MPRPRSSGDSRLRRRPNRRSRSSGQAERSRPTLTTERARVIYSIYSENLKPENWQHLARETGKELNGGAAGVLIPHGTDTLHFTTAALSFMLQDLTGPVVVVGAQRSSDRPSSDAALNLISAA